MCGILGSFGGPFSDEFIARFSDALTLLKHRGPDGTRLWSGTGVLLGHTRLSIVDLSEASGQPMADVSERYRIVFNGEIYNYLEIRKELEGLGAHFITRSDAEVILEAFKAWGAGCLERFNGMWAFAIFDTYERELFLARDRYGVKPLYHAERGGRIYFGSEMKALLALGVDSAPDWEEIGRFVQGWGCDAGENTPFRNIRMLAPGHFMIISPGGRRQVKWWDIVEQRLQIPKKLDARVELFGELFEDAVRLRLRNDVNTGIALSGGIDSSSVYGAARKLQKMDAARTATGGQAKKFRVFSASFPGSPVDEYPWAEKCLGYWEDYEKAVVILPKAEMFPELVDDVVWHQEAPVVGSSVIGYHILYRAVAATGTRVILEGHGADELLGGYQDSVGAAIQGYASRNNLSMGWQASQCYADMATLVLQHSKPNARSVFAISLAHSRGLLGSAARLARRIRRHPRQVPRAKNNVYINPEVIDHYPPMAPTPVEGFSLLNQDLYSAFTQKYLPSILHIFDRATMAYSVESRAPFMDYRIVQYGFSLPDEEKIGRRTKEILRRAAVEWVPREVINRKMKMPFVISECEWFNSPAVGNYLLDVFHSSDALNATFLNGKALSRDLEGFTRDGFSRYDTIRVWKALNLYLWHKFLVDPYRQ